MSDTTQQTPAPGDRLVKTGGIVFIIGALATLVTVAPLFLGSDPLVEVVAQDLRAGWHCSSRTTEEAYDSSSSPAGAANAIRSAGRRVTAPAAAGRRP
ncbi:hypothetical protein CLM82_28125 [Streptomyces albidoflavus]|uniref:hypothetical protein n=1 Tax=Streptomyces albidoflavus TaxID=1886 RepID=UPI000BADDB15|nr:hypothetical protein [Streptomyces albidoflavus]PAX86868.1 hypothetical protein CLM82_28125 [Streptomyces albidoflavus]